jgi:hypothetical protein
MNNESDKTPMTSGELRAIAEVRLQWALDAEYRDLHGSAKEWRLTASIALQLAAILEELGRP